mmetsp:Transcript_66823/g.211492  ORF Transcript_66823/g.211492 Transcript_66823/m.211492 type:complete len:218 (+) Transcript_66823:3-656(+)
MNLFSVVLVGRYQAIEDAAMDIPGQPLLTGYSIQATPLSWTASEAAQASSITMGFQVNNEIPLDRLGKVLLTFPDNFAHAIERECNVEVLDTSLPLLAQDSGQCSYIDIRNLDRLLIHLDPNKVIPPGSYQFRFPVTVPEQMPAYNVWLITFCGSSSTSCLQPHGSEAMLTFSLAGFHLGEASPGSGRQAAPSAAWRTACPLFGVTAGLLPLVAKLL